MTPSSPLPSMESPRLEHQPERERSPPDSPTPSIMTSYMGSPANNSPDGEMMVPRNSIRDQLPMLVPPQLSPTKRLICATHTIIKGARSRLCFGRNTATAMVNVLPPVSTDLWSPRPAMAGTSEGSGGRGSGNGSGSGSGRNHVREIVLPRTLFERVASSAVDDANPAKSGAGILGWGGPAKLTAPSPCKPPPSASLLHLPRGYRGGARRQPLRTMRCSRCTMQAHPPASPVFCRRSARLGRQEALEFCPSQPRRARRAAASWIGTLRAQARRPSGRTVIRMPTTQGARRANKERFSHPTPPPPGAPRSRLTADFPLLPHALRPLHSCCRTRRAGRWQQ